MVEETRNPMDNINNSEYIWTQREELMHLQKYAPLTSLIALVEETRTMRFYESSKRDEILWKMYCIRRPAPFCKNKRFPEQYWVNLSVGHFAEAFDRLHAALDIPDPLPMSVTDLTGWKQMFDAAMLEIRRFAYYTDPQELADIGVYNRASFENRFRLEWTD